MSSSPMRTASSCFPRAAAADRRRHAGGGARRSRAFARSISAAARPSRRRAGGRGPDALRSRARRLHYGQAQILYGEVSLAVQAGECVACSVGRNGASKSTTMKAIMGLMARRRGRVAFCGSDITDAGAVPASRASAWASCPRIGASSPTSRCSRRTSPSARQPPFAKVRRPGSEAQRLRALSQPRHWIARPARRPAAERRRAADAHHVAPHADGQPVPGAARRAFGRASRR